MEKQFLDECGIEPRFHGLALSVRRAVAALAGVEAQSIAAGDRFDEELAQYDFWGSLDAIEVVLELEKQLGMQIPEGDAQSIVDPESRRGYTVRDFIQNLIAVLGARWLRVREAAGGEEG